MASTSLVLVRLTPIKPVDPAVFRSALGKLSITAYDLAVDDSSVGIRIGSAQGLLEIPEPMGSGAKFIAQHWTPGLTPNALPTLYSVGTAVLQVQAPQGRQVLNLRLEYRLDEVLLQSTIDYNVGAIPMVLIPDQATYINYSSPTTYCPIPTTAPAATAITLSSDGEAPRFDKLLNAISAALDLDASADEKLRQHLEVRDTPLTAAQCKQIASVIAWNRAKYPAPQPSKPLAQMYTLPGANDNQDLQNARSQFEGDLQNYHATHDTEAGQLANFVFAVSAAIQCEAMSTTGHLATLSFPMETADTATGLNAFPYGSVAVQYEYGAVSGLASAPRFVVPAAYWYSLGSSFPMQISSEQRYNSATMSTEDQLQNNFEKSIVAGGLDLSVSPVRQTGAAINANQAARRLIAMSKAATAGSKAMIKATEAKSLLTGWLTYNGPTSSIEAQFWAGSIARNPLEYLTLVLQVMTDGTTDLVEAIKAQLHIGSVAELVALKAGTWQLFFHPTNGSPTREALLPDFTLPGSLDQRIDAFLRRLQKFFTVPSDAIIADLPPGRPNGSGFGIPAGDAFQQFLAAYQKLYGKKLDLATSPDISMLAKSAEVVFPNDIDSRT